MNLLPRIYRIASLLLTWSVGAASDSTDNTEFIPDQVTVITSNQRPLQPVKYIRNRQSRTAIDISVYSLDAIIGFEHRISEGLPNDETQAKIVFQQRLEKIGKVNFKTQFLRAYQGLFLAAQYQIDRYPAIILDNQYFIYGVADLNVPYNSTRIGAITR